MRRFIAFGPAFVVLITALVALLAVPAAVRRIGYANTEATIQVARAQLDNANVLELINASVRNIASAVEPSVVHIAVESPSNRPAGGQRVSQGSGWVYDLQGNVVTNAHVIRGNSSVGDPQITVQFYDGRTSRAEVVGIDPQYDIAVLRTVTNEGIFPARRATGVELSQGDRVYAFGSPFGFKFSMSEGIISGLGRSPSAVALEGGYTNFIQTDAAVNPGNSGGPLVDVKGRVVGMNVAIATGAAPTGATEGQSSGISFAIPLDTIESVVTQLISGGAVVKGYIGIALPGRGMAAGDELEDINRELMEGAGYQGRGVYVSGVSPETPAEKAGIQIGDIITRINNRTVAGVAALRQLISINRPGDKIPVHVWRSGEQLDFEVVLADLAASTAPIEAAGRAFTQFGVTSISETNRGILVLEVAPDSPAAGVGLAQGVTITGVEGQHILGSFQFFSALAEHGFSKGSPVSVSVRSRDGETRTVTLQQLPR
jgi:S1-C subfamily serine protease